MMGTDVVVISLQSYKRNLFCFCILGINHLCGLSCFELEPQQRCTPTTMTWHWLEV